MDADYYNALPHISWETRCLSCNQTVTGSKVDQYGLNECIPCGHNLGTFKVSPNGR